MSWNSLWRTRTHRDPPESASQVQGLKAWVTAGNSRFFFKRLILLFYVCECLACVMYVHHAHAWCPQRSEGIRSTGTEGELPRGCWESNLCPLQEQHVLSLITSICTSYFLTQRLPRFWSLEPLTPPWASGVPLELDSGGLVQYPGSLRFCPLACPQPHRDTGLWMGFNSGSSVWFTFCLVLPFGRVLFVLSP